MSKNVKYKVNADKVLIIPGYTDEEILKQKKKDKKTGKTQKITPPAAFYFEVENVQYTPNIASYEDFNSAQGLIKVEKACDRFAEVEMNILVHQNISDQKGKIMIDKKTKEARLRVTDNSIEEGNRDDGMYVSRWVRPEKFTDEYIEIRNNFFQDLDKRPLTIISALFPPMPVAYMTECNYTIGEGEEEASYSVTFSEVSASMI